MDLLQHDPIYHNSFIELNVNDITIIFVIGDDGYVKIHTNNHDTIHTMDIYIPNTQCVEIVGSDSRYAILTCEHRVILCDVNRECALYDAICPNIIGLFITGHLRGFTNDGELAMLKSYDLYQDFFLRNLVNVKKIKSTTYSYIAHHTDYKFSSGYSKLNTLFNKLNSSLDIIDVCYVNNIVYILKNNGSVEQYNTTTYDKLDHTFDNIIKMCYDRLIVLLINVNHKIQFVDNTRPHNILNNVYATLIELNDIFDIHIYHDNIYVVTCDGTIHRFVNKIDSTNNSIQISTKVATGTIVLM